MPLQYTITPGLWIYSLSIFYALISCPFRGWRTVMYRPLYYRPTTSHTQATVCTSAKLSSAPLQPQQGISKTKTHVNLHVLPPPHGAHGFLCILSNLLCEIIVPTRPVNVDPMGISDRGAHEECHDIVNIGVVLLYGLPRLTYQRPVLGVM
jgi:hypothetical protein